MNGRIKELAEQAWKYANDNSRDGDETHGWLYRDKFAELIVRECATACEKNSYLVLNGQQRAKQIREHFGVEE